MSRVPGVSRSRPSAAKISAALRSRRAQSAGRQVARRLAVVGGKLEDVGAHAISSCLLGARRGRSASAITATSASATQAKASGCPSAIRSPNAASCVDMPRFASSETASGARQRRAPRDERLREPVLRRVDEAVDARGGPRSARPRASGSRRRAARGEPLGVEVEAEHARQREEARRARAPAARCVQPSAAKSAAFTSRSTSESR